MILARREFLKLLGLSAGAAGLGGCGDWLVPDDLVALALRGPGLVSRKQTVCGLCEGGCGLTVRLVDGLPVGLKGNPRHPLNRGGLCPVGQASLEVLYAPERLQGPLRRGPDGEHRPVTWDEALAEVAGRLTALRAADEGHRIALLSDEPDPLFHDLARQFADALGSANLARVQGGAAAVPYRLSQGLDEVPGFDLGGADLVLSFGLDLYEDGPAPVHAISAMVGSRPTAERGALVHVGTRLSPSATKAEERVAVLPGTHGALALGLAHVLVREGSYDRRFVEQHTFGFDDWTDGEGNRRMGFRRLLLERYYPDHAGRLCGCDPARIIRLARRLARASAPLAVAGGEAVAGANATWTVIAVHALNALLGAFDRRGGVVLPPPIPLTPLEPPPSPDRRAAASIFAPDPDGGLFGLDPVEALAERVLDGTRSIDVLFLFGANPVHTSPAAERLRQAMERIPLIVALSPFRDATAALAHLILPTPVFLEAWRGSATPPTVPFNVLGVSRPVIEPLFDTRHPGDTLLELARRTGAPAAAALPWTDYSSYLKHRLEGVFVSGLGSVISGSFEESWVHFLEERGWRFLEHGDVASFWDDLIEEAGWWNPLNVQGDWARLFRTPSGRFEFFSRTLERRLRQLGAAGGDIPTPAAEALARAIDRLGLDAEGDEVCLPHFEPPRFTGEGDLVLLPFRPMTARGSLGVASPMVLEMFGFPVLTGWQTWAEIAPETAAELDLGDGDVVAVESERGAFEAVVRVQPGAVPGAVHMPLGLGHSQPLGSAGGVGSNPIELLTTVRDPVAGTLALAATAVSLRLSRRRPHGGPAPIEEGAA